MRPCLITLIRVGPIISNPFKSDLIQAGAPFATQFFNDDDDEYGSGAFNDPFDAAGEGVAVGIDEDAELLAATQGQVRRARPEFVNYAKKVKRVDVRKLKENIWKGLDIIVPKEEEVRYSLWALPSFC